MKQDLAIKVHNLYKSFDLPENKIASMKQLFVSAGKKRKKHRQEVLKGIDFEVKKGEFLGIVGRNGGGKSTLLKLLAGVYTPDSGAVELDGNLTPFIELGVGFNPELSGHDNVYLNTSLLGYTRKQTNEMYHDIVKFAELEEHMDKKLKNYSSGMQVRLAFSIAIKAKNDILIFDEVLAVGDVNFQRKCFRHFTELKRNHQTVVFVSHSMEQVKDYCTRVIVIDGGTIIFDGDPEKAVAVYDELNEEKTPVVEEEFSYISGNGSARVQDVAFSTHQLSTNDDLTVKVHYKASPELEDLYYGISIYRGDRNQSVFALADKLDPKKELLIFKMKKIPLTPGKYYFTVGLTHEPENWKTHYDLREKQYTFTVKNTPTSDFYALAPAYIETEVKNEA